MPPKSGHRSTNQPSHTHNIAEVGSTAPQQAHLGKQTATMAQLLARTGIAKLLSLSVSLSLSIYINIYLHISIYIYMYMFQFCIWFETLCNAVLDPYRYSMDNRLRCVWSCLMCVRSVLLYIYIYIYTHSYINIYRERERERETERDREREKERKIARERDAERTRKTENYIYIYIYT